MSDYRFGVGTTFYDLAKDIAKYYDPSKSLAYNKALALELYYTRYQIHDFTKPGQGMSANKLHPKETYDKNHMLDNYMRRYLELDINAKLGLDFNTFINQPTWKIARTFDIVDDFIGARTAIEETMRKKLEAQKKNEDSKK